MLTKLSNLIFKLRDTLVYAENTTALRSGILDALEDAQTLHRAECDKQFAAPTPGPTLPGTPQVRCVRLLLRNGEDASVDLFIVGNEMTPSKIMAIKTLRNLANLGLKEAKDVLDSAQDAAQVVGYSGVTPIC